MNVQSENNIFNFATKELSQDAIICWMINFYNNPSNEFYSLGKELLQRFGIDTTKASRIRIYTQVKKADVVIVIPDEEKILIIEDKVHSSEHDNQIETYKGKFEILDNQRWFLEIDSARPYSVQTVFWKTGYIFDQDKIVESDYRLEGKELLEIISKEKYTGKSEVLDSYRVYLKTLIENNQKYKDFTGRFENQKYYLNSQHVAQHNLMRFLFPESVWWKQKEETFMVQNGSNRDGSPWTQMHITSHVKYPDSEDSYIFFWRIDSDKNGPYLALRFYDSYDKKDDDKRKRHENYLKKYQKEIEKCFMQDTCLRENWDSVSPRITEKYYEHYETSVLSIQLKPFLDEWQNKKEWLYLAVGKVTNWIIKYLEN